MFAFHVNRLKACIFKVSQMSGFLVFPSSLPPWEKTQESLMQNASFAILETGHGNEELEQIDNVHKHMPKQNRYMHLQVLYVCKHI